MIRLASGSRSLVLASLVAASLGQALLALAGAWCVQTIFNGLLPGAPATAGGDLVLIAVAFAGAGVVAGAIEIYRAWAAERLGIGYTSEVREALFERIINATPATLKQHRDGALLLPFVGDLTAIKKWVSDGLVRLISATVTGTALAIALVAISPALAGASALVLLSFAGATLWLSRPLSDAIRDTRSRRGALANFVSSSIRSASTIQAFGRLPRETKRLRRRNDALMRSGLRLARLAGSMSAASHLTATALVGTTLIVGLFEVRTGAMSIGSVAAAMSIAGLLAGAVRDLGVAFELSRRSNAAFARVARTMNLPTLTRTHSRSRAGRKDNSGVVLQAVTVSDLLHDVDAEARPGTITRIAGASGAGKSALLAVIAGLQAPDSGRVRLGGRDIYRASSSWLRRRIGFASAATPLLRGTFGMNLRYRDADVLQDELDRAVIACNLQPVIDRLPEGLQTRLSDGGSELSKSEIQRLLIARALIGPPGVLLLDEVDTHLGEHSAAMIAAALRAFPGVVILTAVSKEIKSVVDVTWQIEGKQLRIEQHLDLLPPHPADPARERSASSAPKST